MAFKIKFQRGDAYRVSRYDRGDTMTVNYCEVCPHRCEQDGKLTCTADEKHKDENILECGRIIPEWCPIGT